MAKAVHSASREYEVVRLLSSPPLCHDPMNHTIRKLVLSPGIVGPILSASIAILALLECTEDQIAFIVMEEWSSELIPHSGGPCCWTVFVDAIRQCIEVCSALLRAHFY